jgi:hypothetical protein
MKKIMYAALAGCCLAALSCATTVVSVKTDLENQRYAKKGIRRLVIKEGVTEIPDEAFRDNRITGLVIPESVTSIGYGAFWGNRLTSLVIPESVTSIGEWAFANNQLTSLVIPEGVTSIGEGVFYGNRLTSLVIPEGVTSIGEKAFAKNQLTSLVIPEGVTSIGEEAFYDNRLTSLVIPEGVTIGNWAFLANQLTSITFEGPADCAVNAFGDWGIVEVAVMSGKYPGTYTRAGDGWRFNGAPLPTPATLVMDFSGDYPNYQEIVVLKIDGADPSKFYARKERTYIVPPGMHSVEVMYKAKGKSITYKDWGKSIHEYTSMSKESVEHRYLFEGKTYRFTGEPKGDQIIFRIVPQ